MQLIAQTNATNNNSNNNHNTASLAATAAPSSTYFNSPLLLARSLQQQQHHSNGGIGLSSPASLIMADDVEFMFTPGSVVTCVTCLGKQLEGEVIAFDYEKRVLLLKTPSVQGAPNGAASGPDRYDVQVLNLSFVTDLKVKKEVKKEANVALPELNITKVSYEMM